MSKLVKSFFLFFQEELTLFLVEDFKPFLGVINESKAIERNFQNTDISLLIYCEAESNRENFLKLTGIDASLDIEGGLIII